MDATNTQVEQAESMDIQQDVLTFLDTQTKRSWGPEADLFAAGGLSSLFAMQLVVFLEKTYGIAIRGKDLRLDNFRTVVNMVALVERLRSEL
ncbi:acyl carrier protein [Nocardia sp. SYP-A9097]|uniref:acyl carrier protein n=1 Tax=Nocardia sp. SYP-A9097 TaxID=2663237 RepID=UPI002816622D|nr:acyl carrier protein [Nocardia sp. SYP-A9097]